jgi:ketosteroid isomerase-like protein
MKTQKKTDLAIVFISLFLFGIVVFWGSHVFGKEWTPEQKEIWELVQADYELFKQGDLEGVLASRHADLVYWGGRYAFPMDKNALRWRWRGWFASDKPAKVGLEPITIKISGNVASVFFEWTFSGKRFSGHVRVLRTYIKQNNKWLIINSMTCSCDKLPPCER